MTKMSDTCSVCGSSKIEEFFAVEGIPVLSCALWPTRERAERCVRGDISLGFCLNCGFIENLIFDPELTDYSELYENALHFSKVYQQYAKVEAERMVERLDLHDKDVIEIGCGDGKFLSLLCTIGGNRARGFDPSYHPDKVIADWHENVTIVPEYYGEKHKNLAADLVASRHVLEHIPKPLSFMQSVRSTIGDNLNTHVCFEVPNALFLIQDLSIWDIIYEHCSYFTQPSLQKLFERAGFEVNEIRSTFENQCLAIEAKPKTLDITTSENQMELERLADLVTSFSQAANQRLANCRAQLECLVEQGKQVALWGTGARAVIYLNMVNVPGAIGCAVDINPRKHGAFLPGTGQEIVAPEQLIEFAPDTVLIMNPIYKKEIAKSLEELGIVAELVVV